MVVSAKRVVRKGGPAVIAAFTILLTASSIAAPTAQATRTPPAETAAWTPVLTPLDPRRETVKRNLSGADRSALLNDCWPGYLCVAAGEGDGQHTVYELYYCTERSLSNFIDAGALNNNQAGNAVTRLKDQQGRVRRSIAANEPERVVGVDWRPIWYIDPC